MAKEYRPYGLEQAYLLPQAPREWLPEGHLALFLEDAVSLLDIEEIAVRVQERAWTPGLPSQDAAFSLAVRLLHGSLQFQENSGGL